MHICPVGSSSTRRGQYFTPVLVAVPSYLICLTHIISNVGRLDARAPYHAPTAELNGPRQERWSGSFASGSANNHYQPPVPAVNASGLQPYQFPRQVSLPGYVESRSQQQQLSRQHSSLPATFAPLPPRLNNFKLIAEGARNVGGGGSSSGGNNTYSNSNHAAPTPAPPAPVLAPNQPTNQQQVRQPSQQLPFRQAANYYNQKPSQPQVLVSKQQVVQQQAFRFEATSNRPTTTAPSLPVPPLQPRGKQKTVYGPADVIGTGALFSCLGCDPRLLHPLYRSLVSLQNPLLLGGDILVRTSRPIATGVGHLFKSSRSALVDPVSLWPNGIIFYELDESVAHLAGLIWRVMQQFHAHTCIRFVARQNNEPDFIRIAAHRGCSSYIGRIGGEQALSLGDGCEYRGTVAHELLHAVGFYHHQNRSDRDDFLEIIWENVAKGKEDQFRKMAVDENFLLNEFDYNSIMLYGPHTFGKTLDKITMKPKREGVILLELIEKRGLSALDIDSVNKLYKCGSRFSYDLQNPSAQRR